MSVAVLEALVLRVLQRRSAPELDEPSLSYLASLLCEEVSFLHECPGSMTGAQLLHVLSEALEGPLVTYELAHSEQDGKELCAELVHALRTERIVQLADDADESDASGPNAAAASPPSAASLLAAAPPRLSSPVRISDLSAASASAEADSGILNMASIMRANTPWSPAEEAVLFQSLADSNARRAQSDGEEEEEDEIVDEGGCEMCQRHMPLTRHHLIPRKVHKQSAYARLGKEELNRCALICRPCHSAVHKFEDEKTLAARFNTLPLLMADPRVQAWVAYISKRRVNRTQAQVQAGAKLRYGR